MRVDDKLGEKSINLIILNQSFFIQTQHLKYKWQLFLNWPEHIEKKKKTHTHTLTLLYWTSVMFWTTIV